MTDIKDSPSLNKRVDTWVKGQAQSGHNGLMLGIDIIKHMADGSRDWDAAARFLSLTAPDPKKPDTAHRSFRLMLAAYFGAAIKLQKVDKKDHYSGYRFVMDTERCPAGQPVTPSNHWSWVTNEADNNSKSSITSASFYANLKAELTGENKETKPVDVEAYGKVIAKRLIKDHKVDELNTLIATIRKVLVEEAKTSATESKTADIVDLDDAIAA